MCACTSSAPSSSFLLPTMRRSTSQSYSISSPSSSAVPLASSSSQSTSSRSSMYSPSSPAPAHRRSGVLRTTASQQDIARQRSQALLASVIRGDITLDAILAFPIDWASIALEEQELRREDERQRQEEAAEELLPTRNPLAIKRRESRTAVHSDEQPATSPSSSSLGLDLGQPSIFVEAEAVAIPSSSSSSSSSSPVSSHSPMSLPPSLCNSPRSTASSEATLCEELATPKHQSALTFDEEDEENHSGYCSGNEEEAERKPRKVQRLDLNLDYDLTIPSSPSSPSRSLYNEDEEDESSSSFFAFTSSSSSSPSSKDLDPLDEMFDFGAPSDSTAFASREANDWMVWPTLSSATVF